MGITPSQLLGLDYVWRGAPRVRLASPSLDTLALDLTWRGAPLVADALEPEPLSLWASPLLELEGAAEAQVVQSMWGAGAVSLFGVAHAQTVDEVRGEAGLTVEGEAAAGASDELGAEAWLSLEGAAWLPTLWLFRPAIDIPARAVAEVLPAGLPAELAARAVGAVLPSGLPRPIPARAGAGLRTRRTP